MRLHLSVNRQRREVECWEGASLLSVLREGFGLWGTKNACEQGECGSCSVVVDGVLVCACLELAATCEGREVTTIEGLTQDPLARVIQEAFIASGAVQCGFCTPGFIVAMTEHLRHHPDADEEEVKEALAGNLCRCTGYTRILDGWRRARANLA